MNAADYSMLGIAYNSCEGDEKWNPALDFNGDGCVDNIDREVFTRHWKNGIQTPYCDGKGGGKYACPDVDNDMDIDAIDLSKLSRRMNKCLQESASCTDNDGGDDPYKMGTVRDTTNGGG